MIHSFIIAAISADGYIAERADQVSTSWTSAEDKTFFSERTKQAGVVVMGATTFKTIGRALPGRHMIVYSTSPIEAEGVETTTAEPMALLADLEQRGFKEIAICGGASIYTQFMKAGAVQTLYLTVHPVVFGAGIPLFTEPLRRNLVLTKTTPLSPSVLLLEYSIQSH